MKFAKHIRVGVTLIALVTISGLGVNCGGDDDDDDDSTPAGGSGGASGGITGSAGAGGSMAVGGTGGTDDTGGSGGAAAGAGGSGGMGGSGGSGGSGGTGGSGGSGGTGGMGGSGGTGGTSAAKVLFSDVKPIFEAKCADCHVSGSSGGLKLTLYADTQKDAGNGACSGKTKGECSLILIKSGTMPRNKGCSGTPADDTNNNACLTQAELDKVQAWVDDGQLEN